VKVGDLVQDKWHKRSRGYGIILGWTVSEFGRTLARLIWFRDGESQELRYNRHHLEVISESR
jgi:hypothetical protein